MKKEQGFAVSHADLFAVKKQTRSCACNVRNYMYTMIKQLGGNIKGVGFGAPRWVTASHTAEVRASAAA